MGALAGVDGVLVACDWVFWAPNVPQFPNPVDGVAVVVFAVAGAPKTLVGALEAGVLGAADEAGAPNAPNPPPKDITRDKMTFSTARADTKAKRVTSLVWS